ncbi:MAG: geranylgeranyl reductase family protein [Fidelibacterota bacterium]
MTTRVQYSAMKTYDAIIVGLGPAGSSAAYQLALRGYCVLGLEKAKMPRDKPCGGCLSAKIRTILDEDLESLAEEVITEVILTFHGEGEIRVSSRDPVAYMISRATFDHHLAKKAGAAGAEIHDGEAVRDIDAYGDGYVVHTDQGTYRGCFLVGADGVNGLVGRTLGYGPRLNIAVAIEGEATVERRAFETLRGTVRLDLGVIPYGYGWIFPKKDHWSLGVGSGKELSEHPERYYSVFLDEQRVDRAIVEEKRRGYRIPLFAGRKSKVTSGRSLLIGDAAALVDPFLGEGIYYAIRSGQMAAEAIDRSITDSGQTVSGYQERIAEEIYPEFEAALKVAELGYHFTRLGFAFFMSQPTAGESYLEVLRGSMSYRDYWRDLKQGIRLGILEFLHLLRTPAGQAQAVYDREARQYDAASFLWRQTLARTAWQHFEEILGSSLKEGGVVLDAGTGTGDAIVALLRAGQPAKVVGADISMGMLRMAREKFRNSVVEFQRADITQLPYADRSFDAVISTWAIESVGDPKRAVQEFLRVIKDDGYVIYAFANMPSSGVGRLYSFLLEKVFTGKLDWRFLSRQERPYHDCDRSSLATFANGLTAVVVLRKCCTVEDELAPCRLPDGWQLSDDGE